jgi:transposase
VGSLTQSVLIEIEGPKPRLSPGQLAELAVIVETGPNRKVDGVVRNVAAGAHAVLLLDRAGWHTTAKLEVPANITPIFLPSRAPELNPVENVWEFLRSNWLSNLVFDTYDEIIDAACDAWRNLEADPERITSIGMRKWAHIGHSP